MDGSSLTLIDSGHWYLPAEKFEYGEDYFSKYKELDRSDMAAELTKARVNFVTRHTTDSVVDIGIGGGLFCKTLGCRGYDVNPLAIEHLKTNKIFCDPYANKVDSITCWDSLEHIDDIDSLLSQVNNFLFVSIPIFECVSDISKSKHFKPGEHIHYFTVQGIILFMKKRGFITISMSDIETRLGREGIMTFAFLRCE